MWACGSASYFFNTETTEITEGPLCFLRGLCVKNEVYPISLINIYLV